MPLRGAGCAPYSANVRFSLTLELFMESESFGRTGELNAALELVQLELPLNLSAEEQSRLAIEIYKARLNAESIARLTSAVERLVTTLDTSIPHLNRG